MRKDLQLAVGSGQLAMMQSIKFAIVSFVSVLCLVSRVFAQDIHFSQFNFSPLNQNPANTNLFNGDYRFVGNYKNQWPTVPVKFNTISLSADMNFATLKNGDRVGGGLLFFFDKAGDSKFTALNGGLSLSYIKTLDKGLHHFLSIGAQVGVVSRSFDYSQLNFDNQWTGEQFDPNTSVDESFAKTRSTAFDIGAGLAYQWRKVSDRTNVTVGFGMAHLNNPVQSFYNDKTVTLLPRYTAHSRGQIQLAKRWDIVPELMFQRQQNKQEFDAGAHMKYYIPLKAAHVVALNLGAYGRFTDAGWLMAGMDYDNLQVNFSYDMNFTALSAASRYNGGFEVSVIYIITKVTKINKPGAVCPTML